MDQDSTPSVDTSLAAHAFGELRAEISLLRRAVERLTDERTSQPDYAPSLEGISKRLEDVCVWAQRVSEKPALKLTPESLGNEIAMAAASSRADDQRLLERATAAMDASTSRIDALGARSRSIAEQDRELLRNRIAFAVAGMVTFAILPGAVARSLPVSWAVPERIAARMLGTDMWRAGQSMMAKADPDRWNQIVAREQAKAPSRKYCQLSALKAGHSRPDRSFPKAVIRCLGMLTGVFGGPATGRNLERGSIQPNVAPVLISDGAV